jgi:hypothetical protein
MRLHIDDASARRYFTGAEQDAMKRQIAPTATQASEQAERLVRRGLAELRAFDRTHMTQAQGPTADIFQWDLENCLAGGRLTDLRFPFVRSGGHSTALLCW